MIKIIKSFIRIIILLFVIGVGWLAFKGYYIAKDEELESQPIADKLLPEVVSEWDEELLIRNLAVNFQAASLITTTSDGTIKVVSSGDDVSTVSKIFNDNRTSLGKMKSHDVIVCKAEDVRGMPVMAVCGATFQFEKGSAIVGFGFSKQGNERKIVAVNINIIK